MKKFFQKLKNSYWKHSQKREVYDSIDTLPIKLWNKVNETGDFSHLVIEGTYTDQELKAVWMKIYNQFIQEFGIDEKYQEYMKLKKQYVLLNCELALTGDRFKNTQMNMIAFKMEQLMKTKSVKFGELVAYLSIRVKFPINTMETSVKLFYNYLKQING